MHFAEQLQYSTNAALDTPRASCGALNALRKDQAAQSVSSRTVLSPSVLSTVTEPFVLHISDAHRKGPAGAPVPFSLQHGRGSRYNERSLPGKGQPTYAARFWFSSSRGVLGSAGN
jgi:hypothetical protein